MKGGLFTGPARWRTRDGRFWLLVLALAALAVALAGPGITRPREGYDVLLVVDITGSMNARDMALDGAPASRIAYVRQAGRALLAALPCGSHLGLGIFTERRPFLLFEPAEVCANFAPLDGALASLTWRMAWEGDSRIASGLDGALEIADGLDATLLFLTDGHEAPPRPPNRPLAFDHQAAAAGGAVVGVGGFDLVPIPRHDRTGQEIGFYGAEDVPHETRLGPPPADASSREGWHPRNAPWGAKATVGTEHLTAVREPYLRTLAEITGLSYRHLTDTLPLLAMVQETGSPRPLNRRVDLRPLPAGLALLALLAVYGAAPLLMRAARPRSLIPRLPLPKTLKRGLIP